MQKLSKHYANTLTITPTKACLYVPGSSLVPVRSVTCDLAAVASRAALLRLRFSARLAELSPYLDRLHLRLRFDGEPVLPGETIGSVPKYNSKIIE